MVKLGSTSQTRVTAKNRFTWTIIITNLNGVDVLRAFRAERKRVRK